MPAGIPAIPRGCTRTSCLPLSRLIHAKTGGNAFFAHHLLRTLEKGGLLRYENDGRSWQWDIADLKKLAISENVVDLMDTGQAALDEMGFSLKSDISGSPREDVAITLYRIAQESLNNIAKHALAGEVVVDLACNPVGAILSIKDDGRGFDPQAIPAGHLGVSIMRERAQKIGAKIKIDSEIGSGTHEHVSWSAAENDSEHG